MPGSSKHASAIFRCCFLRNMYVNCAREISYSCFLLVRTEQQESWRVALSTPVENSAGWWWRRLQRHAPRRRRPFPFIQLAELSLPSNGCRRHGIHASFPGVCSRCTVPVRAWAKSGLPLLRARAPRFNFVRLLIVHFAFCARLDSTPAGATFAAGKQLGGARRTGRGRRCLPVWSGLVFPLAGWQRAGSPVQTVHTTHTPSCTCQGLGLLLTKQLV
jgi:hypothetical protein